MQQQTQISERIYYDEQDRTEFTGEVTEIRELARVAGRQLFQVSLDRSAFYPTSGGQPYDTGTLVAIARSGAVLEAPVLDVSEDENGEVWHTTPKPLQPGTFVTGRVDALRRRDHMQQHTGQHLLSAVLFRDYGVATVSFHLGESLSSIDLSVSDLTREQLEAVERNANDLVAAALPIQQRLVSRAEAESLMSKGLLRKLPDREGDLRLIEIADLDLNACGGTHVSNTAQIGPIFLRGTDKVRSSLRLSFLCGNRSIAAARRDWSSLTGIAAALSVPVSGAQLKAEKLLVELRSQAKQYQGLLGAAAALQAKRLSSQGAHVTHALEPKDPALEPSYARLLASALVREPHVQSAIVLAGSVDPVTVTVAAKAGFVDCGTLLQGLLGKHGLRGGGSPSMAECALPQDVARMLVTELQQAILDAASPSPLS